MKTFLDYCIHYACLGYDVTLTSIYCKDGIRMVKRYSHPAERSLTCIQICDHESLKSIDKVHDILDYMYNNIQEQEQTGKYYEPQK